MAAITNTIQTAPAECRQIQRGRWNVVKVLEMSLAKQSAEALHRAFCEGGKAAADAMLHAVEQKHGPEMAHAALNRALIEIRRG
jgi:hypothetical protein